MQDNNESADNEQKPVTDEHEGIAPHTSGDVIHPAGSEPSISAPETTTESKPELNHPSTERTAFPPIGSTAPLQPTAFKKKTNLKSKLILLLVIVFLAVAGAFAWQLTSKKDANNKTGNSSTKETQEIEVLNIGSTEGPASVFFPDEGLLGVQVLLDHQVYEGLVGFEEGKVTPLLAQSWTNPDQKTWIFKVRPNIKFHTGKDVKAADIKASLENLKQYEYWSIFVSTIDTIEATGDLELTIKTTEPDALLLNRLAQAFIADVSAADKPGSNGTGAYTLDTSATNSETSTTLKAVDNYHGERAKTRKLILTLYESDEKLAQAIKDKKVDIIQTVPIPAVDKVLNGVDLTKVNFEAPGSFGLYMNQIRNETTPLKNKEIRLAAAQAMDRQTLIDTIDNKNTPSYQVIPSSLAGHDESIKFPSFDLEAAKKTLANSGYKNTPLEFGYIKELQLDAPILIQQLRAAGFNIKEKAYESEDVSKALADLRASKFDFFAAGYSSDVFDARDILGGLLSSTESTYPNYKDATFDKLLADSDTEFDPIKRINLLQQANKRVLDELAWVPLRNSTYVGYYNKDIDINIDYNGGGALGAYYRKVGRIVQ